MADPKGFLKTKRQVSEYRPVCERVKDYRDVVIPKSEEVSSDQASRCMDCGTPFCHWACPVGNYIPEWNDAAHRKSWDRAFDLLNATNNFPEFTGRICPALCEYSCVLGINDDPVTIRENELAIIEDAFKRGIIRPSVPDKRTGKRVAVIGSGPAGLAAAASLNRAGHNVTVYERDEKPGGLLRYGIPDFKLEKWVIDRRVDLMKKEGVEFKTGVWVGRDVPAKDIADKYDAVCLAAGSRVPRDLKIKGRELSGIHFAMDYLTQSNLRVDGKSIPQDRLIDASGKRVVVIGGGDTGSDCVGTAHRQGAACVVQIELMPKPSECRTEDYPWPKYPLLLKTSSSHKEGGEREWSVLTKEFVGSGSEVKKLRCVKVEFSSDEKGCPVMKEVAGSGFDIDADMVIIAAGFLSPEQDGIISQLKLKVDKRKNVATDDSYMTSVRGIFSAGDMRRGQSLVVWAISEGRRSARAIDVYLSAESDLPEM